MARKAIESVVKNLNKQKGALKDLELALVKREQNASITIECSLDGRLQGKGCILTISILHKGCPVGQN